MGTWGLWQAILATALQVLSLLLISRIIPTRTSSCKFSRYQLTDSHGLNDNTKSLRTSMALDILPDDLGKGRGQSRGIGATQVEATSVARGMPLDCLMFLALTLALALRVETCQGFRASESLRLSVRTIGNWIYHSPELAAIAEGAKHSSQLGFPDWLHGPGRAGGDTDGPKRSTSSQPSREAPSTGHPLFVLGV